VSITIFTLRYREIDKIVFTFYINIVNINIHHFFVAIFLKFVFVFFVLVSLPKKYGYTLIFDDWVFLDCGKDFVVAEVVNIEMRALTTAFMTWFVLGDGFRNNLNSKVTPGFRRNPIFMPSSFSSYRAEVHLYGVNRDGKDKPSTETVDSDETERMVEAIVRAMEEGREDDLTKAGLKVTHKSKSRELEEKLNDPQVSENILGIISPAEEEIITTLEKYEAMEGGPPQANTKPNPSKVDDALLKELTADARNTVCAIQDKGPSLQLLCDEKGSIDAQLNFFEDGYKPQKVFESKMDIGGSHLDNELSLKKTPEKDNSMTMESLLEPQTQRHAARATVISAIESGDTIDTTSAPQLAATEIPPTVSFQPKADLNSKGETLSPKSELHINNHSNHMNSQDNDITKSAKEMAHKILKMKKDEAKSASDDSKADVNVNDDTNTETKVNPDDTAQTQLIFQQLLQTSMEQSIDIDRIKKDTIKDTFDAVKEGNLAGLDLNNILGDALSTISNEMGINVTELFQNDNNTNEMKQILSTSMSELMTHMKDLDIESEKLYEKLNHLSNELKQETQNFEDDKNYELEQLLQIQNKFRDEYTKSSNQMQISSEELGKVLAEFEQTGDIITNLAMFPIKNNGQKIAFILGLALLFKVPFDSLQLYMIRSTDFSDWFTNFTQSVLCLACMNHYGLLRAIANQFKKK